MTVSTCVNISTNSCDLSREVKETFSPYWFRVKAVVGSEESEYVETNEFILQKHGKFYHRSCNSFPRICWFLFVSFNDQSIFVAVLFCLIKLGVQDKAKHDGCSVGTSIVLSL